MNVSIVRGGGLAGLVRHTELRSDQLSADDAADLSQLVASSQLPAAPDSPPAPPAHPDEMSYSVTVKRDGDQQSARFTESTLPREVRKLIAWVDARPEHTDALTPPGSR